MSSLGCALSPRSTKGNSSDRAGGERATSADDCRRVCVGVSVQKYSVQCKGYNLIGVTTVEASETKGTTALVYLQLHSSLYTGTVCILSSFAGVHPTGLTADQGCRQVSTSHIFLLKPLKPVFCYLKSKFSLILKIKYKFFNGMEDLTIDMTYNPC